MTELKKDLWNAHLYDDNHAFVSSYGHDLIELLNSKQGERVLDLGCGTGDLTHTIHGQGADVVGIDNSENMIQLAKNKYPDIPFFEMDAAELTFNNEFDAVFSNAALHWIKTPKAVLQGVYKSLKPGGRFVAEFGGAGNVQIITDELIRQIHAAGISFTDEQFPWYFPSIGQYTSLLESAGFHVHFALHFDRPTKLNGEHGLTNWLEMFSPSLFEQVANEQKEAIFQTTSNNLAAQLYRDSHWYADYKRLRILAVKK